MNFVLSLALKLLGGVFAKIGLQFWHEWTLRKRLAMEHERDEAIHDANAGRLTLQEWEDIQERERKKRREDSNKSTADRLRDAGRRGM